MLLYRFGIAMALSASASLASAQTSTCMSMGPDMVHCNSSDGASTNCMRMGDTMATCHTMGGQSASTSYDNDGQTALGTGLVDMVRGINERSFRSKIGKMLAAGDCPGAVKYAFEKGRIEFGVSLQQACSGQVHANPAGVVPLEERINQLARGAHTPIQIDGDLSLTRVQARGTQLQLIFVSDGAEPNLDAQHATLVNATCSEEGMLQLLREGGSVRARYFDAEREEVGAVLVAAEDCGIR